jgi:hypothetical protein
LILSSGTDRKRFHTTNDFDEHRTSASRNNTLIKRLSNEPKKRLTLRTKCRNNQRSKLLEFLNDRWFLAAGFFLKWESTKGAVAQEKT